MIAEQGNVPAKLIKEFRKTSDKPILKGAYVEEMTFIGDNQLDALVAIKSKNELIADVILALNHQLAMLFLHCNPAVKNYPVFIKTLSENPA